MTIQLRGENDRMIYVNPDDIRGVVHLRRRETLGTDMLLLRDNCYMMLKRDCEDNETKIKQALDDRQEFERGKKVKR